jgi:flavin reductase (DIM6/NTAB) family NADH-FMN oxidoreductase RutF
MPPEHFARVPLAQSYRLINHGPTALVSARHAGQTDVMAAAWVCALDYGQTPRVTVVLDKSCATRALVEASGVFALSLPTAAQVALTVGVGTDSLADVPDKLAKHGVELFDAPDHHTPLVQNCAAWLLCKVLPEPHNQQDYDLFIGHIVGAWADERVFSNGRWHFDLAPPGMRTIHHIAGGQFFVTGQAIQAG